jgi:diguanylate cyclase (GGDEF)-like protein/PAS domain S-box-containing protein
VATWSRRLSSAQAKQPGTSRRATAVELPDSLPEDILADDQAVLRALGALAKGRPGFRSQVTVRAGTEQAYVELEVEVRHTDGRYTFDIVGGFAPARPPVTDAAPTPVETPLAEADEPDEMDGPSGDRVIEMLTDTLVITPDIVAIFASVGAEALWANDAFATAIPIREADKIWLIELLDEWSKAHFEVNVLPALVQHGRWYGRLVLHDPDDADGIPVTASLVAHRDRSGEIEAVTLVARDLRPLHEADERIRNSASPLAALVENYADIIIVVEGDGRVLYSSPAATRLLGIADGQLDGSDLFDRLHPDDLAKVSDFRSLARPDEDGIPPSVEMRVRAEDGSWRIIEVVGADLTENTVIGGVVLTARDLTDRVEAVQRLADRAYTDPLTLLPNRMRLLDRVGAALQDTDQATVVMLFDLDGFTAVNDQHGRTTGDEVLRQVAHRLSDETRPQDVVARLEGDTFAMVMRNVTDIDGALVAADRIKTRLGEPYRIGSEHLATTVSVGIAVSQEGQTAEALLSDADKAVGIAKQSGGDRIEVLTAELRSSAAQRRDIEGVLRRALTGGEGVEVHYQPIFDLHTGRIAAAEALLRVHDDEGALLSPASFLEAAEDSGLIAPLGSQVLQVTCQQLAAWSRLDEPDAPQELSVNVSPRQLSDPQFAAMVGDAIDEAGIEPGQLCLEITESMMIGDRGIIDDTVAAVRGMGVAIGLDDFGAGQSSLGYLKRFSLDFVKIDRELIGGLGRDEGDTAIVRATIELAHSLGLLVVAVGVEVDDQLEILKLLGADRAQGFLYAPAVPADELPDRVRVSSP